MENLFVLAGTFAFLFALIILSDKTKRAHHWILAILAILIIISCFYIFKVYSSEGDYYVPIFSEINYAIPLLYGVLLFFYAKSLTRPQHRWEWTDAAHVFPFLIFLFFLFFNDSVIEENGYPIVKLIVNPIYIGLTLVVLKKYRNRLRSHYSSIDHMYLYWLSWVTFGALALWIVACLGNVANHYNNYDGTLLGDYFLTAFLALLLFTLAYVGFNRTHIFQSADYKELLPPIQVEKLAEEQSNDDTSVMFDRIEKQMKQNKPYLDANLSLQQLAQQLNISSNKLSNTINAATASHFFDYVNNYRIEHVKNKLLEEDLSTYSIMGIANESGFQSKATFNRIFKKKTGVTPTAFIKKHRVSVS